MNFIDKLEDSTLEQAFDIVKDRLSQMAVSSLVQAPQVSEVKAFDMPEFNESVALVSELHKGTLNKTVMQAAKGLQIKEFKFN